MTVKSLKSGAEKGMWRRVKPICAPKAKGKDA